MKIISKSEKETQKIAIDFAKKLRGGEVILMYGDLGAGKTVFAKALAKALGVREVVKSPTFNLMKCYKIPTSYQLPATSYLCHIDAYRLKNFDNLMDIGADEYIGRPGVIAIIEWAERIMEARKQKNIETKKHRNKKEKIFGKVIIIKIQHGKEDDERAIEIK
jgi:tRNA threonylcarbamoyladenosine biosynthesis protein TsaE